MILIDMLWFSSQARLYSLQADPATYCNEPDGMSLPHVVSFSSRDVCSSSSVWCVFHV